MLRISKAQGKNFTCDLSFEFKNYTWFDSFRSHYQTHQIRLFMVFFNLKKQRCSKFCTIVDVYWNIKWLHFIFYGLYSSWYVTKMGGGDPLSLNSNMLLIFIIFFPLGIRQVSLLCCLVRTCGCVLALEMCEC